MRNMRIILAFLIALISVHSIFGLLTVSAETPDTVSQEEQEEILRVAKNAVFFGRMIRNEYTCFCIPDEQWNLKAPFEEENEMREWLKENGLYMENVTYRDIYIKEQGREYCLNCAHQFPEQVTYDNLVKLMDKCFAYDICSFLGTDQELSLVAESGVVYNYNLFEIDGKLFGRLDNASPLLDVGNFEIVSCDENKAVLNDGTNLTIDLIKTDEGYRVSGGSYFKEMYGFVSIPSTGDSTPIYLTFSLLSLAALTVTAVGVLKKRKKAL